MPAETPALDDQRVNPAKVFVGGLGQQTSDHSLKSYFSQFGTVEDAAVVIDKANGRSRGFGFCTFTSQEGARHCLSSRHKIDGVSCEVRRAVPREQTQETTPYDAVSQPGKAFIGGLPDDISEDRLVNYFSRFGLVREATLMYDKTSHRPRGFGFVTFKDAEDVKKAIGPQHELGKMCEVKLAEPRPSSGSKGNSSRNGGRRYDDYDRRGGGGGWGNSRGNRGGGPYESNHENYYGPSSLNYHGVPVMGRHRGNVFNGPLGGFYGETDGGDGNYSNFNSYGYAPQRHISRRPIVYSSHPPTSSAGPESYGHAVYDPAMCNNGPVPRHTGSSFNGDPYGTANTTSMPLNNTSSYYESQATSKSFYDPYGGNGSHGIRSGDDYGLSSSSDTPNNGSSVPCSRTSLQ